ncbi:MAG: class I SAM-dependent methyltransferase [Verrucomicrobia bacterium]|nr:class I SAM-dependent methyltransferase [Verrucomicrobiota bacterium]
MAHLDIISRVHNATKRNYVQRVVENDKAECAEISKRFDIEYFDGDRKFGYGGFRYDGRWVEIAKALVKHYDLKPGARILDIGCAKGFLVHDFMKVLPESEAFGLDVSHYAIANAMPEVKGRLIQGNATSLPYPDNSFDLVVSINTLHNLRLPDLEKALREIERVGKKHKFVVNDSYRNEREKVNLMYWQLTCECFFTPEEWQWVFDKCGYRGDYDCIYFE